MFPKKTGGLNAIELGPTPAGNGEPATGVAKDGAFDELGRGAMGITYKAFDTVLEHAVALKVIDARIASHPEARERFLREARAAARLRHPNVASVFYYGGAQKRPEMPSTRRSWWRAKRWRRACGVPGPCRRSWL